MKRLIKSTVLPDKNLIVSLLREMKNYPTPEEYNNYGGFSLDRKSFFYLISKVMFQQFWTFIVHKFSDAVFNSARVKSLKPEVYDICDLRTDLENRLNKKINSPSLTDVIVEKCAPLFDIRAKDKVQKYFQSPAYCQVSQQLGLFSSIEFAKFQKIRVPNFFRRWVKLGIVAIVLQSWQSPQGDAIYVFGKDGVELGVIKERV